MNMITPNKQTAMKIPAISGVKMLNMLAPVCGRDEKLVLSVLPYSESIAAGEV
jgi:hypothetical protein